MMADNEISKYFANLLIYVPYCVFNFYILVQKLQIPNPKKTLHNLQRLLGASAFCIEALGIQWFH